MFQELCNEYFEKQLNLKNNLTFKNYTEIVFYMTS